MMFPEDLGGPSKRGLRPFVDLRRIPRPSRCETDNEAIGQARISDAQWESCDEYRESLWQDSTKDGHVCIRPQ